MNLTFGLRTLGLIFSAPLRQKMAIL